MKLDKFFSVNPRISEIPVSTKPVSENPIERIFVDSDNDKTITCVIKIKRKDVFEVEKKNKIVKKVKNVKLQSL